MLALATTIGDRIHKELAVYGANIVITPAASQLEVKLGSTTVQPATANAFLHESDLAKLKTIFWANNITAISPELDFEERAAFLPMGPALRSPSRSRNFGSVTSSALWSRVHPSFIHGGS